MAIGLSLKKENLLSFKKSINEYVKSLNLEEPQQVFDIDMCVQLNDLSVDNINDIKKLEPFGEANKLPIFVIKNLKIDSIRAISDGKHLKLRLKDDKYIIDAIGFNMGELTDFYKLGEKVDILGNLEINSYGGNENIQMNLKDIAKSI